MALTVSVDDFKEYMKVDYDDEDDSIADILDQAESAVEAFIYTGLSEFESIPAAITTAVKLYAAYFFEERGADSSKYKSMRMAFENLLYPYRDTDALFGFETDSASNGD